MTVQSLCKVRVHPFQCLSVRRILNWGIFDPPNSLAAFTSPTTSSWHIGSFLDFEQTHSHRSCWMICRNWLHVQHRALKQEISIRSRCAKCISTTSLQSLKILKPCMSCMSIAMCQPKLNMPSSYPFVFKKLIISRFHFFIFEAKTTSDFVGHHTKGLASK